MAQWSEVTSHLKCTRVSRVFEEKGDRGREDCGLTRDVVEEGQAWLGKARTKGQRQGLNTVQRQRLVT